MELWQRVEVEAPGRAATRYERRRIGKSFTQRAAAIKAGDVIGARRAIRQHLNISSRSYGRKLVTADGIRRRIVVGFNASTSPIKEGYAVSDSNVIKLAQPGVFIDSLTEVLCSGARALLTQAVQAEVTEFLAKHADLRTATGHQRVVRHGHLPEREIMTGIGPVAIRQPRVHDREAAEGERIRYSPSIVPRYARRSKSLEVLIPILYLKGLSTGDFEEALASPVGKEAPGLSASTIARLKEVWTEEHARRQKRDLSAKRYVYCWADGIHLEARLEEQAQCILVIIGATPEGRKELVGFTDSMRESSNRGVICC